MSDQPHWTAWRRRKGTFGHWEELLGLTGKTKAELYDALMTATELSCGGEPGEQWDYRILPAGEKPREQTYSHRMLTPRGAP